MLIGYAGYGSRTKSTKNPPTSSGGGFFRGDYFCSGDSSRTSTLAGQGTLPSPTAGSRIRFPESLLMLKYKYKLADAICQIRGPALALDYISRVGVLRFLTEFKPEKVTVPVQTLRKCRVIIAHLR